MLYDDIEYFRRRAEIEDSLCRKAAHREAAMIHAELATRYRALADEAGQARPLRSMAEEQLAHREEHGGAPRDRGDYMPLLRN